MNPEKLSDGTDPLTGDPVGKDDIVRNGRISGCLSYVCGILDKIAATGSYQIVKRDFTFLTQQMEKYPYSDIPVTVSAITKGLNSLIDPADTFPLKNGVITEWLTCNGFLMNVTVNGNQTEGVTDTGRSVGIISEKNRSKRQRI